MKNQICLRVLLASGPIALWFGAAPAAAATCTGGSALSGYYGMQVSGTATPGGEGKFLNGAVAFNGACGLSGSVTIGENDSVNSFANISGSYGANADGSITVTLNIPGNPNPETYDIGVSGLFKEGLGIETDGSAVASIDLKPQVYPITTFRFNYNNSSLKGTWAATCGGNGSLYSDLNYFTFDGAGNIVNGTDHYNNGGFGIQSYIGYYGVNYTGTFGGYVVLSGGSEFGFSGVIDNNYNEIQFVYSTAGATGFDIVSCTAKRV
jgi:hypothetical protein